jgi:DNA polymerase III delta prime subunit
VILPQILTKTEEPVGRRKKKKKTKQDHRTMESLTLRASTAASPLQRRRLLPGRQRATYVRATASAGEPDLSVRVNGLQMPNPFVIGSGPPGTNYTVMKRAFDEGWGAVIAKTVSRSLSPLTRCLPFLTRVVSPQSWHPVFLSLNASSLRRTWVRSAVFS